jgi:hypothetical protein
MRLPWRAGVEPHELFVGRIVAAKLVTYLLPGKDEGHLSSHDSQTFSRHYRVFRRFYIKKDVHFISEPSHGVLQIITDNGDFATVPGVQVFTANRNVIQAARTQGQLVSRT